MYLKSFYFLAVRGVAVFMFYVEEQLQVSFVDYFFLSLTQLLGTPQTLDPEVI